MPKGKNEEKRDHKGWGGDEGPNNRVGKTGEKIEGRKKRGLSLIDGGKGHLWAKGNPSPNEKCKTTGGECEGAREK